MKKRSVVHHQDGAPPAPPALEEELVAGPFPDTTVLPLHPPAVLRAVAMANAAKRQRGRETT